MPQHLNEEINTLYILIIISIAAYIDRASKTDLGNLLIEVQQGAEGRKYRERIYIRLLGGLTDHQIDEFQVFYDKLPKYFAKCLTPDNMYRVMTAIATDIGKQTSK